LAITFDGKRAIDWNDNPCGPQKKSASLCRLEEILLPAVEDRGLQAELVAELRDRLLLQQMPPEDGNLFFRRVVLPLFLQAFSPLPYWENAFSISN
jgi:hypothetical protein